MGSLVNGIVKNTFMENGVYKEKETRKYIMENEGWKKVIEQLHICVCVFF
jgi:hypothetical protein